MADRTLGQVAYEKHAQVSPRPSGRLSWDQLRPPVRARWETIATAVIEERQQRNVVITACPDPGCGDGCDCGGGQ